MSELFLKEEKVLTLKDIEGVPSEVQKIDNPELLPVCLKNKCTMKEFKQWLERRNIPQNREGLEAMTKEFGKSWLENKNFASLSDHYWIKKRTETWKRTNFFTNIYSKDIGDMAFRPWTINKNRFDSFSPDLTTNGILKKRWLQYSDRKSYIVKAGSLATHQEPLSEVLVSVLAEQLGIPCVKYDLCVEGVTMCSKSDNFVTLDTELVPAYYLYYDEPRDKNKEGVYAHLIRMCEKFDVPGAKDFIDQMIFLDCITGNEDRNLANIGFIRDISTMKFVGPAPLYDSGNAYWSTKNVNEVVKSKVFGDVEEDIFNAVKKNYNLSVLLKSSGYKDLIMAYPHISDTKKENLISAIAKRNKRLCMDRNEFVR